jgi:hypothetical protein
VMVSPLNNAFTFKNAHSFLQCAAYQARGGSNFSRQMTRAFRTHKPTIKELGECVLRGISCIPDRNPLSQPLYSPRSSRPSMFVRNASTSRVVLANTTRSRSRWGDLMTLGSF